MKIVGCDLHTRYQQIAMLDQETGEVMERRLEHESGEARAFYASLAGPVRVGIEATGHTRWLERMLAELGHELWIGDAAQIRASMVRKQKTDARDAAHLLALLLSGRFPRLWRPTMAERDLRQLVWHRQKLVWMRNAIGNQLHALAMGEGVCRKKKLFTKKGRAELESLPLDPWASRRRQELLRLLDELDSSLEEFDQAVAKQAEQSPAAVLLMTHPGVGPVTSLALVLTLGPVERFARSKQVVSYLGLNPREHSSGGTTTARLDFQARQSDDAFAVSGSRPHRGAVRSRVTAGLSTTEAAPRRRRGQGCDRQKVGGTHVLDAAQPDQLRAAGSHARQPEGHPGGPVKHRWPDWAPCLLERSGSLNNESWSEVT
jgi:transposase